MFKIGKADNVLCRVNTLKYEWGTFDLENSKFIKTKKHEVYQLEKFLHYMYSEANIDNTALSKDGFSEWFDISIFEEVIKFIEEYILNRKKMTLLSYDELSSHQKSYFNLKLFNYIYNKLLNVDTKTIHVTFNEIKNFDIRINNFDSLFYELLNLQYVLSEVYSSQSVFDLSILLKGDEVGNSAFTYNIKHDKNNRDMCLTFFIDISDSIKKLENYQSKKIIQSSCQTQITRGINSKVVYSSSMKVRNE